MKTDNFVLTLGTAQDGGYPHIGCFENCCLRVIKNPNHKRFIASLAIVDNENKRSWIIDITPDINSQFNILHEYIPEFNFPFLSGIFLTHAHIGHYTGLLNLGLEVLNLKKIPVYVLPKMRRFLIENSMFNQMIENENIIIKDLDTNVYIKLNKYISIKPFYVPHRNELSETVGYIIKSNNKSIIYIPDIDSWDDWNIDIIDIINKFDVIIIDGTFYSKDEIKHRNIDKIPHPTILETTSIMNKQSKEIKNKIFFTHLNHTNKVLDHTSKEFKNIITSGYNILKDKQTYNL